MIRGVGRGRISLQDNNLRDYFTNNALGNGIHDLHKQAAYFYNNHIYISYADVTNQLVYVMAYDTIRAKWSDRIEVATLTAADSHLVPSILVDASGYIHIFYDAHTGTLDYLRSTNPEDISQWITMDQPTNVASYPQVFEISNGDFYLFYRGEAGGLGGHDAEWRYRVSNDSGVTWGAEVSLLDGWNDGDPHGFYATFNQRFDYRGDIYCGFQFYDGTPPTGRFNVYYMWYDVSASQWKTANNVNITGLLPLTLAQANANCLVRNSGANETTCARGKWIFEPAASQCHCVVYSEETAPASGNWEYKYADWKGGVWNIYNVGVSGTDANDNCCLAADFTVGREDLYIYAAEGNDIEKWWSINLGVNWNKVRDIVTSYGHNPQIVRNTPSVTAEDDYIILGTTRLFLYQHSINDFIKNYMELYPWTFLGYEQRDLIQIFPTKVLDTDGILMMDAGNRKEIIKGWDLDFSLLVQYLETCHSSAFEIWLNRLIDWVGKIKITPHSDRWYLTYHVLLLNSEWLRRSIHELKEDSEILLRLEKLEPYIN